MIREPSPPSGVAAGGPPVALAGACAIIAGVAASLLAGFFKHTTTLGAHDWDYSETARFFVVESIARFGQFPFWDPFACGGFPAWGAAEGGTTVVSPFLPVYLGLPFSAAVRVEVVVLVGLLVAGLWFFARRYVEHPLGLAFVCVVGGLSSRMALQAAVGHAWHLYYAGTPWVLGALDRALADRAEARLAWLAFGAAVFAFMIYGGGIYPVPHTAMAVLGLGLYRARASRSWRPLVVGVALVTWGAALAAPKLFVIVEVMDRFPRFVRSPETVPPGDWLAMFLSSASQFPGFQADGLDYLWQEYGQYVGVVPLALVLWANLRRLQPDPSLRSLRFVGWGFMALALGAWGPWRLLHLVPPWSSQRVPTRFTYPAFMLFAVVTAHVVEQAAPAWRRRLGERVVNVGLWSAFALSAALIAREDMRCTLPWFSLEVPSVTERAGPFVQYAEVPREYGYGDGDPKSPAGTNGAPGLLVHRAGVGAIRCSAFPGLNQDAPLGQDGRPLHMGAKGVGDPLYRGELWVEPGGAGTSIVLWSPSEVVVEVHGAKPGDLLVLNQNWASGWSANGVAAIEHEDLNAHALTTGDETVTFRYRPRSLLAGLVTLGLALLALPCAWRWRRRASQSTRSRIQTDEPVLS